MLNAARPTGRSGLLQRSARLGPSQNTSPVLLQPVPFATSAIVLCVMIYVLRPSGRSKPPTLIGEVESPSLRPADPPASAATPIRAAMAPECLARKIKPIRAGTNDAGPVAGLAGSGSEGRSHA